MFVGDKKTYKTLKKCGAPPYMAIQATENPNVIATIFQITIEYFFTSKAML